MSEIFNTYDQELADSFRSLDSILGTETLSHKSFKEVKFLLNECEKTIKLLETEQVCLTSSQKQKSAKKVKEHKRNFDKYRKRLYALEKNNESFEKQKMELMSARTNSTEMMKSSERAYEINEQLRGSVKLMYENLDISEGVNYELKRQSDVIQNGKKKVVDVRHELTKSERKIKSMMLRIRRNKSILYGILALIVLVIIIVLVSHFRQ